MRFWLTSRWRSCTHASTPATLSSPQSVNDNRLTRIEGLEPLTKLTTLWLARNQIAFICDALDNNLALTDLNLSANLVGNFKDIPHLSRLRHLKSLSFGDPHYGECPVCALCNYQTYVLFHVHHLSTLDSLRLTDEARQLAEATYMKKKMCAMTRRARNSRRAIPRTIRRAILSRRLHHFRRYYNMRIKTLKRNTSNVIKKTIEARQAKVSQINLNLNVLLRQKKDVERELHEREAQLVLKEGRRA